MTTCSIYSRNCLHCSQIQSVKQKSYNYHHNTCSTTVTNNHMLHIDKTYKVLTDSMAAEGSVRVTGLYRVARYGYGKC